MDRKKFIKTTTIFGASLIAQNSFGFNIFNGDPEIGIHLPGSHSLIRDKSNSIEKSTDLEKYFFNSIEEIKKNVTSQSKLIIDVTNRFKSYPKGKARNGLVNKFVNSNIREVMDSRNKVAITPVYAHKSDATSFDFSKLCDSSNKVITEDNCLIIQPTDQRPDCSPFEVEEPLAYLMKNPKWYCIGLPKSFPETYTIDDKLRKEIYLKTSIETKKTYYKKQFFSFRGSSICEEGLVSGPIDRSIYYEVDEAITKFYDLTDIKACGDPKDLKCNLKI